MAFTVVANEDGSFDIYIQATSPGADKEANWLPVSKEPFTVLMRLYSPREGFSKGLGCRRRSRRLTDEKGAACGRTQQF
ncbi:DUF1214 domain-containing protein [Neomesorhizobium albiziae]|uniref:DUF1214 domain-containing protein n=1 Tax=Neomesorhizobium albiziae TaxID=335020 RepID=UPI0032AEE923